MIFDKIMSKNYLRIENSYFIAKLISIEYINLKLKYVLSLLSL